jgi:pilus assembly protein CpaB
MMEKSKPFILLGLAIIIALVTSVLIYFWLQGKPTAKEQMAMETVPVVVAAGQLPLGTKLTENILKRKEMIKTLPYLRESRPLDGFSDPLLLKDRVLIATLNPNEPILESRLAPVGSAGGIAAVISPKKRAMAVKVDKVIGVAGFIYPNNRIDVLVTLTTEEKPITKIVLENILVLAVGTEVEKKEGGEKKSSVVDVITLEVTPEEAEMLALAATQGRLQLALRGFADQDTILTKGKTVPFLLSSYSLGATATGGAWPLGKKVAAYRISRRTGAASATSVKKQKIKVIIIRGAVESTATF